MYIDTYIVPVPQDNKAAYQRIAQRFADIARDHGVQEIVENWEVNVPDGEVTDFRKAVNATTDEKIVTAWVIWPDRDTAEKGHKTMMEDPRMAEMKDMPFDGKRMVFGSFEPIVTMGRHD